MRLFELERRIQLRNFVGRTAKDSAITGRLSILSIRQENEAKVSVAWWGEYRNAYNNKAALRTIEITDFPALAKAQSEDIEEGIARINEAIDGQPANVTRSLPILQS